MDITERFTQPVIDAMKSDVQQADGNEVFWTGIIDEQGIVTEVKAGARGNENSVIVNSSFAREGHVLIHNHPSGILYPSEADQITASNSSDTSLGFYIVNNDISDVYVVVEPVKPKKIELLDADEVAAVISRNGPFARKNQNYEERPSQIELLKKIVKSFNENKIGVFEAGTGVGKSYAYLIPSIFWAEKNKERVVISTGTINLQQQLFEKDIPAALKILGTDVKSVLVKGRQNYLCLRRLAEAGKERDLFNEDTEVFDKIADWSKSTSTGSKSDLAFLPSEAVWSKVNSESDACLGGRCPYREQCFVMKVRKEASDANIIVVNHHLLFADIESRMNGAGYDDAAVLPPYRRIIFDEAHGIEDSATSFFSEEITRFKIMKQLNLLFRTYRGSTSGFLVQMAVAAENDFLDKVLECVNKIKNAVICLDNAGIECAGNEYTVRINGENAAGFERIFNCFDDLKKSIGDFTAMVRESIDNLSDDDKELPSVWESRNILRRLDTVVDFCSKYTVWNEHENIVFWFQKKIIPPKKAGDENIVFAQFNQTPLDIAPLMNSGVFEPMSTVVCTSATLKIGSTFSYWMRRTGISFCEEDKVLQGSFESPFPYEKNVIFAVPNDAPFPDSREYQLYVENIIPQLVFAAKGRTLVLFTSHDSLRSAYNSSGLRIMEAGFTVMKQGDDDRFRLLERFKQDRESVLFATESFWEGVDVPGDSLSQVVIVKLPFSVPTDPVFAARSELVEKQGKSSFMELSVPQAVIKFKQGFGRLVRRSDDKGVIVVLDRRIVEKPYGKIFTSSVPKTRRMYNPVSYITDSVEKLLGE